MKTKCVWLIALLSVWSTTVFSAAEIDLGASTSRTPYDRYLEPIFDLLKRLGGGHPDLATVEQLVAEGRSFRYVYKTTEPYVPQMPEVTEATKAGDCKAKALWLASKMDSAHVRFVVGKAKAVSNMNHAWLIWEGPEGWLILDATLYSHPLEPETLSSSQFIPLYSYGPSGKYAHGVAAAAKAQSYGDHN